MPIISNKVNSINESSSIKLASAIINLRAQGKDIIGLNVGEPDFMPQTICLDLPQKKLLMRASTGIQRFKAKLRLSKHFLTITNR